MFTYTISFSFVQNGRIRDRTISVTSENARDMLIRYCNRHGHSFAITVS
jgi:hypothetical protein